jgi:Fic family protein
MARERKGSQPRGRTVTVRWDGRSVDAFVPAPLRTLGSFDVEVVRAAALAEGALGATGALVAGHLEVPARLLLRSEGVASSRIEAIDVPPAELAVATADPALATAAAGEVAGNLRALDASLAHTGDLRAADLQAWHRILVAGSGLDPEHVGRWRDRLGWVGGPTPARAAHVAAPPERVPALMDDLLDYLNGDRHDAVIQAANAHAQFETIHPFADGNGRIGRLLVGWVLRRRLGLTVPPPMSVAFLRDVGGYLAGLTRYRLEGPDPWVVWFAGTVERAASTAFRTLAAIAELERSWPALLVDVRSDAAARRLLPSIVTNPALDAATTAGLLDVSLPTARAALATLTECGILRATTVAAAPGAGRPRRWWVATDLLDLLSR